MPGVKPTEESMLNLTMHAASAEQAEAGVVDLDGDGKERLRALLTFVPCER